MKRKAHEATVREKILKTTRKLLLEQGYEKTTIRQITHACEIQIGTVYHFFRNKEDIFSSIAQSLFERVAQKAREGVVDSDPCLIFAREIMLHLNIIFGDVKSRELYLVAYNSPMISEQLLYRIIPRNREFFSKYCPEFTEEDYVVRAAFINGCLQALTVQTYTGTLADPPSIIRKTIRLMLQGFNVPLPLIQKTLEKL
jgi:AcrR family transcriptional regulator